MFVNVHLFPIDSGQLGEGVLVLLLSVKRVICFKRECWCEIEHY